MNSYIHSQKIKVSENASGEDINITKIDITGLKEDAPRVYIQASMHAAELQGNAVIHELLEYFKNNQPLGNITIIPQCNPVGRDMLVGTGHLGRFDPTNGDNWNRYYFNPDIDYDCFAKEHLDSSETEYKHKLRELLHAQLDEALSQPHYLSRAQNLNYKMQKYALDADIILDLHTNKESVDYLYNPEYSNEAAAYLGFEDVLVVPNIFGGALDEAGFHPWWSLQEAFKKLGRDTNVLNDSYTLELGSESCISEDKAVKQSQQILNYLAFKNVIDAKSVKHKVNYHDLSLYKMLHAPYGGIYEWQVNPGDIIESGANLGYCLQVSSNQKHIIKAPYKLKIISIQAKGALQQHCAIFNIVKL